jgi:thiamine-phosphate pyrophosphorylase
MKTSPSNIAYWGSCVIEAGDDPLALDPEFAERFASAERGPCQLYLISPLDVGGGFPGQLADALDAGPVAAFQFRVKGVDQHSAAALAQPLLEMCRARDTAFIVNDDVALAKRIGADGVHLGQGDGDPREARSVLGPDAQIGVTCHNSRHFAMEAAEAGADYVAFGAFHPTTTKVVTHIADPALLGWWTTISEVPCVAIGGVTIDNALPLVRAGADFLAVSGGVWQHPGGAAEAVRSFGEIFAEATKG